MVLANAYFPTDPSIMNNNGVKNSTPNRHGITGSLNDGAVEPRCSLMLQRLKSSIVFP
jgi:hypothetical protein